MIGLKEHRQLLTACKLLLARFERNCEVYRGGPALDDYKFITAAQRAIAQSKDTLEFAGDSRRPVHTI